MADVTLPIKGGWILCTKVPPTPIKPEFLGVYYAKPEKVFHEGAFTHMLHCPMTAQELHQLYRYRAGARMRPEEMDTLRLAANRLEGRRAGKHKPEYTGTFPFEDDEEDVKTEAPEIDSEVMKNMELIMRIRVLTPDGEVCLEPHEYTILRDIQPYLDQIDDGYHFRELGGVGKAKKLAEQLFYVMSRGIPKVEGYKMLLGQIDRPNVFWLEPYKELQRYFSR